MGLPEKPEIGSWEVHKIRENTRQVRIRNAEPGRQRRCKLIDRRSGDPPSIAARIIRPGKCQRWKRSVDGVALYGAAHNQLVAAPRMVRAGVRTRLEGAAEFREREGRDAVCNSQLHG